MVSVVKFYDFDCYMSPSLPVHVHGVDINTELSVVSEFEPYVQIFKINYFRIRDVGG